MFPCAPACSFVLLPRSFVLPPVPLYSFLYPCAAANFFALVPILFYYRLFPFTVAFPSTAACSFALWPLPDTAACSFVRRLLRITSICRLALVPVLTDIPPSLSSFLLFLHIHHVYRYRCTLGSLYILF
jgi:hypothetical protein